MSREGRYLILVRHSAVDLVPDRSNHEWQLSADGRDRCRQFAPHLRPYAPARFITSQEPKAAETGRLLADALDVPCRPAPDLHEHERRTMPYFPTPADFRAAVAQLFLRPEELVLGEETAVQAADRFETAVHTAVAPYPAENLALVSHGTVITLFVCRHNPRIDPIPFWQQLTLPGAVVLTRPGFEYVAHLPYSLVQEQKL